jgi:hypothetical protein
MCCGHECGIHVLLVRSDTDRIRARLLEVLLDRLARPRPVQLYQWQGTIELMDLLQARPAEGLDQDLPVLGSGLGESILVHQPQQLFLHA